MTTYTWTASSGGDWTTASDWGSTSYPDSMTATALISLGGLTDGFHAFEADGGLRWTNGDAALPASALAGLSGSLEVVLTIAGSGQYLDEGERMMVA